MPYRTTEIPVGTQFSRLTTTKPVFLKPRSDGRNRANVEVQCQCGTTKVVSAGNLMSGNTTSCGCFHKERVSEKFTTHGHTKNYKRSRLNSTWRGMKERCLNPNSRGYRWYGAKGVTIAETWNTFGAFKDWAESSGYADGLEIDRIDSDGPYSPDNCRWVTKKANLRSRDHAWDDELDTRLVSYAHNLGKSPYEVIEIAVRRLLVEEVSL